jgi:hypothetical protein
LRRHAAGRKRLSLGASHTVGGCGERYGPLSWPIFVPTNGGAIDFVARKARVCGQADAILRALTAAAGADRMPPECGSTLWNSSVNLGGVLRLFPRAREPGALHFQAGEISPAKIIAHLPALVAGGAIRSDRLRDINGREMLIEAEEDPLSPIIDGERFLGIVRLLVRAGPRIRIAKPPTRFGSNRG